MWPVEKFISPYELRARVYTRGKKFIASGSTESEPTFSRHGNNVTAFAIRLLIQIMHCRAYLIIVARKIQSGNLIVAFSRDKNTIL